MNLAEFLEALKLCQSLQRFVFIGDHTVRLDVTGTRAVDWPSLVLACIVSPTVDWGKCELEIKSDRSAFQSYFGSNKTEVADSADVCHYRDMILFGSNVAKLPY